MAIRSKSIIKFVTLTIVGLVTYYLVERFFPQKSKKPKNDTKDGIRGGDD